MTRPLAWLLAGAVAGGAALLPQEPEVATIPLPAGAVATGALLVDVDGDGATDLVLSCAEPAAARRWLAVHLRATAAPVFRPEPSRPPLAVERDVVAFLFLATGDAPGRRPVLLLPEQVVLVAGERDGAPDYVRLARHRLVWPAAAPDAVVPLPGAALDLCGDGREALLLPGPDRWTIWRQDEAAGPAAWRPLDRPLPPRANALGAALHGTAFGGDDGFELRFAGASPDGAAGPLVRTALRTPQCAVLDVDGDGRLDLAMHRNDRLFLALQVEQGRFSLSDQPLPLPPDRLQVADPAFDVRLADLDGDGRADLLLTTTARRDDDLETRIDWFLARAGGTFAAPADGRLRVQAMTRPPQLIDVDGDGRLDLVCLSLRTAAMRAFTGDTARALDAQLTLFAGDGKGLARAPLLARPLALAAGRERPAPPFVAVRAARGNVPGDVLVHVDGALERRPLEGTRGSLRLGAAQTRVPLPGDVRWIEGAADDEYVVLGDGEIRHVRVPR